MARTRTQKIGKRMLVAEIMPISSDRESAGGLSERQILLLLHGAHSMLSELILCDPDNGIDETEGLSNAELKQLAKKLYKAN